MTRRSLQSGATMLMIGGGFDLSIGSMLGLSGMMMGIATVFWC